MARDRIDDEYDDDRRDDDRPRRPRGGGGGIAAAKSRVLGPAIGLIVIGGFLLLGSGLNFVTGLGGGMEKQLDDQKEAQFKTIDASTAPADQKQQQKEMMTTIYDGIKKFWMPATALFALSSLLILFGGVQMLRLKGRGLSMTASVMAMIPCFASACCVIGIPVGIWALVVLGSPDVKAAFAAGSRPPAADDYDPR